MQSSPPDGTAHRAWPIKPCRLVREDVWMPPPSWNSFPTLIPLILPATKPVPLDLLLPLHLAPSLPEPSLFKASPQAQLFSRAPLGRRQVVCQRSIPSHQMTRAEGTCISLCSLKSYQPTQPPTAAHSNLCTPIFKEIALFRRLIPQHTQLRCYFWITTDV